MAGPPILRHYVNASQAAPDVQYALCTVPANRALVVSKLTVVSATVSQPLEFTVWIAGQPIVYHMIVPWGSEFTETGLVVLAGEQLTIMRHTTPTAIVHLFGEEVDN